MYGFLGLYVLLGIMVVVLLRYIGRDRAAKALEPAPA
jgi:hypothetical protein